MKTCFEQIVSASWCLGATLAIALSVSAQGADKPVPAQAKASTSSPTTLAPPVKVTATVVEGHKPDADKVALNPQPIPPGHLVPGTAKP